MALNRHWKFALILSFLLTSCGYLMQADINWDPRSAQFAMQSLDLEWVKENFWQCLWYNHYQPPLYTNVFLGLLYIAVPKFLISLHLMTNIAFTLCGFLILLKLFDEFRVHPGWVIAASIVYIVYPYRWLLEADIIYMAISQGLLMLTLLGFVRFLKQNTAKRFALLTLPLVALTMMNSFFHFAWAGGIMILSLILAGGWKKCLVPFIVSVGLLLIVPAKNAVVFGNFSASSCAGIVLSQRVGIYPPIIYKHIKNGELPKTAWSLVKPYDKTTYTQLGFAIPDKFKRIKVLAKPWKDASYSPGSENVYTDFNYNLHTMIPISRIQSKYALWYARTYPAFYKKVTIGQFVNFFSGENKLLDPTFPFWKNYLFQNSYGFSARGVLYIFGFLAGSIYLFVGWKSRNELRYKTVLFVLINLAYSLAMGVFIAYADGQRYRFPFELHYLFLATTMLSVLFQSKKRQGSVEAEAKVETDEVLEASTHAM